MLEKFIEVKMREVASLRALQELDGLPLPAKVKRPDFAGALSTRAGNAPVSVIAEYKRASPSAGDICPDITAPDAARQYENAGASAISILTEEVFFRGKFSFLSDAAQTTKSSIPILRKDFIIDPIQIDCTASSPAAALLLITRLVPDAKKLRGLREQAEQYGMQCVVEVFDSRDIALARESGARIIQVNARDLNTLRVDRAASLKLIDGAAPQSGEIWIQASGVSMPQHLAEAASAGFHSVLVGTSLMRGGEPGRALRRLLENAADKGQASHAG